MVTNAIYVIIYNGMNKQCKSLGALTFGSLNHEQQV